MHTYFIAEVGQNHNGDMQIAKKLIDAAAMPITDFFSGDLLSGVDAVKFTKRDLDEELSEEAANAPYDSPHAFGPTYLEHRKALEFSFEQHAELEQYAHSKGLDFVETLCSPGCLELLDRVRVDYVKIASRDVTNIPLLEALARVNHPIIISTGICSVEELEGAIEVLSRPPEDLTILHCISQYPAEYENINLQSIGWLKERFPRHQIGYSDHSIGIVIPAVAVGMGATLIEKHVTLDRKMKGSDHAGSLAPEGLWRVMRDIRNVERSLGAYKKEVSPAVRAAKAKLERSLALSVELRRGEVVEERHLCMLSPGNGLSWQHRERIVGKRAIRDLNAKTIVKETDFE
jgi:sialic acid synthase